MNRLFSLSLSRTLIRCVGAKTETSQFLQGMITNDVNHLEQKSSCIYALFLNKAGRVLYDSIIYKTSAPDDGREAFLIECDSSVASTLAKHLKLYRVRRKIDVTVSDEHDLWCLQGPKEVMTPSSDVSVFTDPRLKNIGLRIITPKNHNLKASLSSDVQEGSSDDYTTHRYRLGIGEGIIDLPPEKSFPLESNCDYMHGVSFHKGCYIGQEFTARTHHTGVVRKRLMPLFFENPINFKLDEPVEARNEEKASMGKVRNVIGKTGLGLLRIDQALAASHLTLNENEFKTERPSWWPIEADKKSQLTKS
jgi:transferase CAF17, mitochondrial